MTSVDQQDKGFPAIYYLESSVKQVSLQDLPQFGLKSLAVPGVNLEQSRCLKGPTGKPGLLLVPRKLPTRYAGRLAYEKDGQEWREAGDGVWMGWRHDCPPDEAGLRRLVPASGHTWRLKIGAESYAIPVLRRIDGSSDLPSDIKLNPFREQVKRAYVDLWDRSGEVFDWMLRGEIGQHVESSVKFAVEILGLSYHYGELEQNALGLIDSSNWQDILAAACDLTTLESIEAAKKKAGLSQADLPNSSHGNGEESETINQAALSCS